MNSSALLPVSTYLAADRIGAANNPPGRQLALAPIRAANTSDPPERVPAADPMGEAVQRIAETEAGLQVTRVPPESICLEPDGFRAGDQTYRLDDGGFSQLCRCVGAPSAYLADLPSPVSTSALQHHLDERHYRPKRLRDDQVTVFSRGGRFLNIGRGDLLSLTGSDVVSTALEGINESQDSLTVSGLKFSGELFVLDFVSSRVATEVRRGDVINAGLRVIHSFLGEQPTVILSFVHRLVCANGLVHRECAGARRTARIRRLVGNSHDVQEQQREQIRRLSRDRWSHAQNLLEPIRRLEAEPVADPRAVFERFLRSARQYSRDLVERLLRAWELEGSELTAFGVLNAITRVATHEAQLSERRRRALAGLAGIFARKNTHVCPHCFSVLRTNA